MTEQELGHLSVGVSEYNELVRRVYRAERALASAMEVVEIAASDDSLSDYVRNRAKALVNKVEPWPEP